MFTNRCIIDAAVSVAMGNSCCCDGCGLLVIFVSVVVFDKVAVVSASLSGSFTGKLYNEFYVSVT